MNETHKSEWLYYSQISKMERKVQCKCEKKATHWNVYQAQNVWLFAEQINFDPLEK